MFIPDGCVRGRKFEGAHVSMDVCVCWRKFEGASMGMLLGEKEYIFSMSNNFRNIIEVTIQALIVQITLDANIYVF